MTDCGDTGAYQGCAYMLPEYQDADYLAQQTKNAQQVAEINMEDVLTKKLRVAKAELSNAEKRHSEAVGRVVSTKNTVFQLRLDLEKQRQHLARTEEMLKSEIRDADAWKGRKYEAQTTRIKLQGDLETAIKATSKPQKDPITPGPQKKARQSRAKSKAPAKSKEHEQSPHGSANVQVPLRSLGARQLPAWLCHEITTPDPVVGS